MRSEVGLCRDVMNPRGRLEIYALEWRGSSFMLRPLCLCVVVHGMGQLNAQTGAQRSRQRKSLRPSRQLAPKLTTLPHSHCAYHFRSPTLLDHPVSTHLLTASRLPALDIPTPACLSVALHAPIRKPEMQEQAILAMLFQANHKHPIPRSTDLVA